MARSVLRPDDTSTIATSGKHKQQGVPDRGGGGEGGGNFGGGFSRGSIKSRHVSGTGGSGWRKLLRRAAPHHDALATLGVHSELQLYAKPPAEVAGGRTLLLTVWLRRTGGGQAGAYPLPHQAAHPERESLRGVLWVSDVADQSLRGPASHAAMAISLANASSCCRTFSCTCWPSRMMRGTAARGQMMRMVMPTGSSSRW
ncbi:hypothetical protein HXX76_007314 [Chlamydomonas incerta]|uniref:Uncharacterized protein n=1 Tax=Chlamydomonas incerta TaxID=51695 RepID=A0A835SXZ4_CHLIN|nr:hypothetical protein HXX76_007314 [Chlamydomonas incerta]|eukprot:KAG2435234.1 hypothetical protein HXX76_007314 [Chlamydomonas incerta]